MSRKLQKDFDFYLPINKQVVRNCRIVTEHLGDLHIMGVAYFDPSVSLIADNNFEGERFSVDIDYINFNDNNIKPVIEWTDKYDEIEEAARQHASGLFNDVKIEEAA